MTITSDGVPQRPQIHATIVTPSQQRYEVHRIDNTARPSIIPAAGQLTNNQQMPHHGVPVMPGCNEATVRVTTDYANYCARTIFAMGVNNAPFAISPTSGVVNHNEPRKHLEVRIELKLVANDSIWETYEMLRSFIINNVPLDLDATGLWTELSRFYQNDARTTNRYRFTFCFVYRIMEDELNQVDTYTFKPNSTLLTFRREALATPHPYSDLGFKTKEHQVPDSQEHAGVLVSVVDNLQLAPIRYYYAGRHVIGVPSQHDPARKDGVYVTLSNSSNYGIVEKQVFHYNFEEAKEKLGLYLSRQEAETHGNPELLLKTKTVEKNHELEDKKHQHEIKVLTQKTTHADVAATLEYLKLDNARLKAQMDRDRAEREEEASITKSERAMREEMLNMERSLREEVLSRERAYRNDLYDHRETVRKDKYDKKATKRKGLLDGLKLGQIAIGAIMGFAGLFFGKKVSAA